jgi:hypothetical protein
MKGVVYVYSVIKNIGKGSVNFSFLLVRKPHKHKLYILRYCINKNVDIKFSAHDAFHQVRSKSKDWKTKGPTI